MSYEEKIRALWGEDMLSLRSILIASATLGSEADTRIKCLEALLARREMQAADLQLENAELRKDAERYRWLREGFRAMSPRIDGKPFWVPRASVLGNLSGPTLDAAIDDAAITGAPK